MTWDSFGAARPLAALALAITFGSPLGVAAQAGPPVDGSGYRWDINFSTGAIGDGSGDAFDRWPGLCVTTNVALAPDAMCAFDREQYAVGSGATFTTVALGRGTEYRLEAVTLGMLNVSRRIWIPMSGVGFARFAEIIENPGVADITFKVRVGSVNSSFNLGSDAATSVESTDRGGTAIGPGLFWLVTDDASTTDGDPAIASVLDGPGRDAVRVVHRGPMPPFLSEDLLHWEYETVTLRPGERAVYVHFIVQRDTAADAAAVAATLVRPAAEDLVGLAVFAADLRNVFLGPPPNCGDGVLDAADGETCDDGNTRDTEACTSFCVEAECGDAFVWAGVEECDDGNAIDDDGCTTACTIPRCGDGVLTGDEACDDGEMNSDTAPDACRTTCLPASCGDRVTDTDEGCDDGNDVDDDACSNACIAASCGDGVLQAGAGEECDDGAMNSDAADACRTSCRLPACGDGIVDGGEGCDDGNLDEEDECNPECAPSSCGDGYVSATEACDEGEANGTAVGGCDAECRGLVAPPPGDLGGPGLLDGGAGAPDPVVQGCGCAAGGDPSSALVVLALLSLRRRSRRR